MQENITNSKNIYLFDDEGNIRTNEYVQQLKSSLSVLSQYMTVKQRKELINDLQLVNTDKEFDESKYLQAACETSIAASIATLYPTNFVYEDKVNPPKDVDCSFLSEKYKFNIEIKCADYAKNHAIDGNNGLKFDLFGRNPNYENVLKDMQSMFMDQKISQRQHLDQKLKDFLISAHNKFKGSHFTNEVNVLVVCCDDVQDMTLWIGYLHAHQGLFTKKSFENNESYKKVDVVMLTNMYHRHYNYLSKKFISNFWDLNKAFNIMMFNPYYFYKAEYPGWLQTYYCLHNNVIGKKVQILMDTIPNYSLKLHKYQTDLSKVLPDDRGFIDAQTRLSHFVKTELEDKGLYYFEPHNR